MKSLSKQQILVVAWALWCGAVVGAALPAPAQALPRKPALGVQLEPVAASASDAAQVRVTAVAPGLTGERLGLKPGDVVAALDGQPVSQTAQVIAWVAGKQAGDNARIAVLRNGARQELTGAMVERSRESDTARYRVEYAHVSTPLGRLRTITTTPREAKAARRPALLFIQGVTLSSVDFPLSADNGYARIVRAFADSGFVTLRVDKPGVGDSEGGPGAKVDFQQELDGYRQGLKALLARPDVDAERVFIFGHSMGGLWGPVLAGEFKLKGIAVAGTTFRTWMEYSLENARRQSLLDGTSRAEVHDEVTRQSAVLTAVLIERQPPAVVAERMPALKATVEEMFPGGVYAGRSLDFWRQVNDLNLPAAWSKASGHVLALWGESDFIISGLDHDLLAAHVNAERPGTATAVKLPRSDHAFLTTDSQADSFAHWGKPGKAFNRNVLDALSAWLKPLAGRSLAVN